MTLNFLKYKNHKRDIYSNFIILKFSNGQSSYFSFPIFEWNRQFQLRLKIDRFSNKFLDNLDKPKDYPNLTRYFIRYIVEIKERDNLG